MKRFLMFPLTLGIVGAFFSIFCWGQFLVVIVVAVNMAVSNTNPRLSSMNDLFLENSLSNFLSSYIPGTMIGIAAGFAFAIWDWVRNRQNQSALMRLPKNLFWCFCYALLPSIPNCVIGVMALYDYFFDTRLMMFPILGFILFNFTAILWASIRSIATDDVLTPRVLRAKLRARMRLQ